MPAGQFTLQAEHHGPVGTVAATRVRQRTIEAYLNPAGRRQQTVAIEALNEAAGCLHRTHGVGTRGSDADLEQVEHADGHFSPGIALFLES